MKPLVKCVAKEESDITAIGTGALRFRSPAGHRDLDHGEMWMNQIERSIAFQNLKRWVFVDLIASIDVDRFAEFDRATAREELSQLLGEIIAEKSISLSIGEREDLLEQFCTVLGLGTGSQQGAALFGDKIPTPAEIAG